MNPTEKEVLQAYDNVKNHVHQTPVLTSSLLSEISGASLFFKCENFQRMGAFKMRGATNALVSLSAAQKEKGVVTHSSGNFAQALSLAAKTIGIPAYIVMPSNAPSVKKAAVKTYGGQITECEPTLKAREAAAQKIQQEKQATFIHPSNAKDVILGNATSAYELLQKHPDLDIIVSPVGGGGLIAGTGLAAKYFGKNCDVWGAEPENADDAYRSLQSGSIETNAEADTVADGLRTTLGNINFPIIQETVKGIILVSEEAIIGALRLIWERLKIVVEPSSAVTLAAILKEKERFQGKKVGIIISGGNVDLDNLPF
ncbi:pyridoxal-phosphate dependent enzyme [Luteirhabdus pelagi]|uniref:pyridoxal-phosphate dependent enzyme n=1 Tax=Luteirhabdus pelagi TaxID=2792783 RepID=UPI00193A1575|nr:pyridoxal-phosphate dependent enzyme [Luteirhabdus pelagi]